jgi:hypothetical protein
MTEDQKTTILTEIMKGRSVRAICSDEGMPARSVIYEALAADAKFADHYARACSVRADEVFDEIFDIADNGTNDWMERHDEEGGNVGWRENGEALRRSVLRVDARKWALSKMQPKKYGDKMDIEHGGNLSVVLDKVVKQL